MKTKEERILDEEIVSGQQWTKEEMEILNSRKSEMTEPKFTREEALKIVTKIYDNAPNLTNETLSNVEIATLEALGLIKFDEPMKKGIIFKDIRGEYVQITKEEIAKTIKEAGYHLDDFIPK